MFSTMFMYLMGSLYMNYQAFAAGTSYNAEILVESNMTVQAQDILEVLKTAANFQVHDGNGIFYTMSLVDNAVLAECRMSKDEYACNCSDGYTWSNEVCSKLNCCSDTTCKHNVFTITPVCIAKVQVHLLGTATLNGTTWDSNKTQQLHTAFQRLNGFQRLNITSLRLSNTSVDFEVDVNVKCEMAKLQGIVSALEASLGAVFRITSVGMVTIEPTDPFVHYMSESKLKCTFEEASNSSGWKISGMNERFELNNGGVVKVNSSCDTRENKSCTSVTIHKVTSLWAGMYECEFTSGSFRHTATTQLRVAPLPEDISMTAQPATVDCSKRQRTENVSVNITATVHNNNETYKVFWSYQGGDKMQSAADSSGYYFKAVISCQKTDEAHYVNVTFKNVKDQDKSARLDIPVIYEGETFCKEDGDLWPKTPNGDTVITKICPEGRVGSESRTCQGNKWQPVFSKCISNHLFELLKAAKKFMNGYGSTPEAAKTIFSGLLSSSLLDSNSSGRMADLTASIQILELMAKASQSITLQNSVLHNFTHAASNMLDQTWDGVNDSINHDLSSNYLESVEGLVKNIQINRDQANVTFRNLELTFCPDGNCKVTLFNINVNMNSSSGLLKIFGVKNLTRKLRNNFPNTVPSPVLISATLEDKDDSPLTISLDFSKEQQNSGKTFCVFWNTTGRWSDEGCTATSGIGGNNICVCNHLTAFSALWGFGNKPSKPLAHISKAGLIVSICSLLIFLISQFLVWSAVVKTNLSHFYHTVMVNIALFLLLAHCSFLISSTVDLPQDPPWCEVVTVCKHLFFLATFCWMLCMSILLVHHLVFVFNPLSKRVFMYLSGMVGYICPMLIVGSTYIYCKKSNNPYHSEHCWLVPGEAFQSSLSSFLIPVGTITLTNLCSLLVVIATLVKSPVLDHSMADHKETVKSIVKAVVFLTPIFGLTWLAGYFFYVSDPGKPFFIIVDHCFCILNSFQGLSILLSGCLAEQKVREELLKLITVKLRRRNEKKMKGK